MDFPSKAKSLLAARKQSRDGSRDKVSARVNGKATVDTIIQYHTVYFFISGKVPVRGSRGCGTTDRACSEIHFVLLSLFR